MSEPIEFSWGDVRMSINAVEERLADPKPVLREFSRKLTADIKENIKKGGAGWPPYAPSTLKRLESTGTSQVSKRGTVRADRVKRTKRQLFKLEKKVRDEGYNPDLAQKIAKIKKRIESYGKAEARAQKRGLGKKGIGKRQSEGRQLLHGMPGTIRSKLLDSHRLYVYSAAGVIGADHNEGLKRPKRQMIPPPNMEESMEYFKMLMESDLGQAWETGKGRS